MTTDRERVALPEMHESWLPREHSLHRPRHANRQRFALACAVVFLVLPAVGYAFGVRPTAFENHRLASFPSPSLGWSFFVRLAPWATDHLAFREQAIHAADGLSRGLFGEPPAYGGNSNELPPIPTDQGSTAAKPIQFPSVMQGTDGWLYLGDELASHCNQAQPTSASLAQLRRLRDGVLASGRKFVVIVAPDKATMVPQYLPADYAGKSCHNAVRNQFWHDIAGQNYILDVRGDLNNWTGQLGAPVYTALDAHWGDEGGVTMARRIADKLQPGLSSSWVVQPGPAWQVPADLPALTGEAGVSSGRYYSILPDGVHDETQPEPTDFTSPLHFGSASGPGTYADSVGLLGDSFTIRATRYLASVFDNITILHEATVEQDGGLAAGRMLAANRTVVVEVAERSLVSGTLVLLNPAIQNTIIAELAAHPVH